MIDRIPMRQDVPFRNVVAPESEVSQSLFSCNSLPLFGDYKLEGERSSPTPADALGRTAIGEGTCKPPMTILQYHGLQFLHSVSDLCGGA